MNTKTNELVKVPFQGHEIEAVGDGPVIRVVIRRICEALGIAFQPQLEKLRSDPATTITMIVTVAADGRTREVACLDLRDLPGWLAGIHPSKVAPAARDTLIAYRREAYEVLADHFLGPRGTPAQARRTPACLAVAAELQATLAGGDADAARRLIRALGALLGPTPPSAGRCGRRPPAAQLPLLDEQPAGPDPAREAQVDAILQSDLTTTEKMLLVVIARHAVHGRARLTAKALAKLSCTSVRTVRRAKTALVASGWLAVTRTPRKPSAYRIVHHGGAR